MSATSSDYLDVATISNNASSGFLADNEEATEGAYLPVNNDDDDYDAANAADFSQMNTAIAGENDLLPILLRKISENIPNGKYTLDIPSHVRVWKNANRTGVVDSTSDFYSDRDTELYVEGIAAGTGVITIDWTNGIDALNDIDEVKITTFTWSGPLNVPEFAKYTYTATGGRAGDSMWIAPISGTDKANINAGAGGTDSVDILWNGDKFFEFDTGGPVVGKAVYQPRAGYVWGLEVNVVQVRVEAPDAGPTFDPGVPADIANFVQNGVLLQTVESAAPGDAGLFWVAKITLNGPNGDRGVKFMRVGFIQNLTAYRNRGIYDDAEITLTANIETLTPLLDVEVGSAGPWYEDAAATVFFNPDPAVSKTKTIFAGDTPTTGVPLTADQGAIVSAEDDVLDRMESILTFELTVSAQTTDTRLDAKAKDIYTKRAKVEWVFNGSGTVDQAAPYAWTAGPTAGITPPNAWIPVTDGSRPIITIITNNTFNDELKNITFQ